MADQNHRLIDLVELAGDLVDIVGQGNGGWRRRVLAQAGQIGRMGGVTHGVQPPRPFFPAPAAMAGAVNENEGRHADSFRCYWRPTTVRAPAAGTKKSGMSAAPGDTAY